MDRRRIKEYLTLIDSIKEPMRRLNRWRARLRGYDYKFIYNPGKLSTNADVLLRNLVPEGESTNSAAPPHQLLRRHECETAFSLRSPDCTASEEDEPQLKVCACPIKIPIPTKTSLARQAQIRASSDESWSDSEVPQTRPRRGRKKGAKNAPVLHHQGWTQA